MTTYQIATLADAIKSPEADSRYELDRRNAKGWRNERRARRSAKACEECR